MWPTFLKILWVENIYLDVFIYMYIDGSKVYPTRDSSIIFHLKNVAVINANDLRQIFNRSYASTKRCTSNSLREIK